MARQLTVIKYAPTVNGFGIYLVSGTYRHNGGTYYEVQRADPQHRCVTLHSTDNLETARGLANREYFADKR